MRRGICDVSKEERARRALFLWRDAPYDDLARHQQADATLKSRTEVSKRLSRNNVNEKRHRK